jgi:hypothetical protein
MFDPGALGTLLIGLDHTRLDSDTGRRAQRRPRSSTRGLATRARSSVAAALRLIAARVDSREPAAHGGAA